MLIKDLSNFAVMRDVVHTGGMRAKRAFWPQRADLPADRTRYLPYNLHLL
jgi:hypothetical protein